MFGAIVFTLLVVLGFVGFIHDATHNPRSGGAYDKLKDYMGWKD